MKQILFTIFFLTSVVSFAQQPLTKLFIENGTLVEIKHDTRWNIANYDSLVVFCEQHFISSEIEILKMLKDSFNQSLLVSKVTPNNYTTEFNRLIDTTIYELILVQKTGSMKYLDSAKRFQFDKDNVYFGDHNRIKIRLYDTTITNDCRSILYVYAYCIEELFYNKTWKSHREYIYRNIDTAYTLWSNFTAHGMFQYPWESFINGKYYKPGIQSPPKSQFIIFHPSVGVEFQNVLKNPMKEVLSLDLIGTVKYYNSFKSYYSVSLSSYFRNDMGAGFGVKLGWNKFVLGVAFHDTNNADYLFDEQPYYFMSVNLFNLSASKVETYETYKKSLDVKKSNP